MPKNQAVQLKQLLRELADEINEQHESATQNMREARSAGVNSPGFNQELGAHDAYQTLIDGDLWQRVLLAIGGDA